MRFLEMFLDLFVYQLGFEGKMQRNLTFRPSLSFSLSGVDCYVLLKYSWRNGCEGAVTLKLAFHAKLWI